MSNSGDEFQLAEWPLVQDLEKLGWEVLDGDVEFPGLTDNRASFREVLLTDRFQRALLRINVDEDDSPWLDEARATQAMNALARLHAPKLIEANQEATKLLLEGVSVEGDAGTLGGRGRTVRFIDFDHPERNEFLLIRQFRVDDRENIIPDIVLFVNGIPLVVVECKSPLINNPVGAGIDQLLRYSNQRGWIDEDEGAERLFYFNQLLVTACGDRAAVGTIGSDPDHFAEWKDVAPKTFEEVKAELGVAGNMSGQQFLAAGLLRPEYLLDVIRHFVLFKKGQGKTVKLLARYPQFRAVHAALRRLHEGKTLAENGDRDGRGGIIWHTQGSGKSFTMTFLVRKLRTSADLRRFKVVVVTDRTDLEEQLGESAVLSGEEPRRATSGARLEAILREPGPDLVFAMIQKYRKDEEPGPDEDEAGELHGAVNDSTEILVLVDEAHRSHGSTLHANLRRALPNCAMIAFTGTPILEEEKKTTEEVFGPFLDAYTLRESEADGATLPIRYEGWEAKGVIIDGQSIDTLFDEYFADKTVQEREAIKDKYANRFKLLEAEQLIAMKARHMLRHYVENVLPRGFKAQVVAVSRKAAVRYREKLEAARSALVTELEALAPELLALSLEELSAQPEEVQFLVRAHAHLDKIMELEFAAVISDERNDPPSWAEWTDEGKIRERIRSFKKPLSAENPEDRHGLAFLCVKSMLLTGFDAPVEQVLYLDRPMKGAELLQAIARVNRTYPGKGCGLVVDYCGIAKNLDLALAMYTQTDRAGALRRLIDDLPTLEDRHRDVLNIFREQGLDIYRDRTACVDLLESIRIRAEFTVRLRLFLDALDMILPRPQGLPYTRDARQLGLISMQARNRYRDGQLDIRAAGPKVEELIDTYVRSNGVDPKIPPVAITAVNFPELVQAAGSARAQASEMEHAIRHHMSLHFAEDPARYRKLSERLKALLDEFRENWDELATYLWRFVEEIRQDENMDIPGLEPRTETPFFRLLAEESGRDITVPEESDRLRGATRELVQIIRGHSRTVDFWRNRPAQDRLRGDLVQYLDDHEVVSFERLEAIADGIMSLARALHSRLVS
jgi:type I restriction enzyme, R subunit